MKTKIFTALAVSFYATTVPQALAQRDNEIPLSDRLYYGPCTVAADGSESVLLSTVLSSVVTRGLSRFGKALRNVAGEKELEFKIHRLIEDVPGDRSSPCMQFVRGRFLDGAPQNPRVLGVYKDIAPRVSAEGLFDAGIYVAERPEIMIELKRRSSQNKEYAAYHLSFLDYQSSLFNRSGERRDRRGGGGERHLAVQFAFSAAGSKSSTVGSEVKIGRVKAGQAPKIYRKIGSPKGASGYEIESKWFSNHNPGDTRVSLARAEIDADLYQLARYEKIKSPTSSSSSKADNQLIQVNQGPQAIGGGDSRGSNGNAKPFELELTIVEMQDENKFLTFLADVFDDSDEQIGTTITNNIDPEKRTQARRQELTAQNEALETFQDKFVEAESAFISYCTAQGVENPDGRDWLRLSKAAYLAQLSANLEAQVIGLPAPYPAPVNVSANVPACYNPGD